MLKSILVVCGLLFATSASGKDLDMNEFAPAESNLKPFETVDVFLGATLLNKPDDDHAGRGRILQLDKDLNFKGAQWVDDTTHGVRREEHGRQTRHAIGHQAFSPDGVR
jgi:hypothetical protein